MSVVSHLARTIQDQRTGRILLGSTVSLCGPGTETPILAPIYSDFALTEPLPNPFVCNDGLIDVYTAEPTTVQLRVQYGGAVDLIDNLPVLPYAEQLFVGPTPISITNSPGTDLVLTGIDADSANWVDMSTIFTPLDAAVLGWFLTQAFQFTSIVRDTHGAMTSADVTWPDGASGSYTADSVSTLFPGKVDGWHVTRTVDSTTATYTQPEVTRDGLGNITDWPLVVVT
jgi:hypothetical protein